MNLVNRRNYCTGILIVATVRRQPISAASGNVPGLAALAPCRGDGVGAAVMGFCRTFESIDPEGIGAT
jgi:hypothetical protein